MTIEEYRNRLIGGTQGSGSSSASSGIQALRERLLSYTPEMELEKIYANLNQSYDTVRSTMGGADMKALSSALAAVRRNTERLQAYSGRHPESGLTENLKKARENYQTMWLEYDRMKRRQAVESSPMASGLKTFGGVMGNYEPGKQLDTGIRGVDVERLADKDAGGGINLTAGAAAGVTMPESEELTEIQGKSGFRRSMENFGSWLKNVGIAGASGYAADMTGGIATGRSGSTAGKEFVSGALQSYIDQRDREQRFVDAYEAGDTSISRQDYEIAKEQIEFLQYYIDMYSKANDTEQRSGELTRDVAQDLYAVSHQHLQSALEGQNTVGQLFTTAGVAGVQQLMDLTLGAGIGGKGGLQAGAQTAMMLRSFGAGANEAAEKGSDATAQIAAGLKTAGIEYFTEKLFGGNPLYDVDVGLVNRAVRALGADKRVLAFLASKPVSVFSEGLEEVLSGVLNPVVDYIATGKADWPTVKQLVEEGIVGVMLGGAGQVVNAAVQDVTAARSDRALGRSVLSGKSVEGLRAAAELAGVELGELNTPAEIGQAFRMVQDEYLNQAIQERAAALGETAGHTLGEAVLAKVREESLTKAQRKAYFGSAVANQIIEEYKAAMSGEVTDDNRWVEDAYVRPSELGSYKTLSGTDALQEGAPETVADDLETVTNAPETVTNAPETVTNAPETVTNAPETVSESPMAEPAGIEEVSVPAVADISTMENTPGNDLMAREVENITGIEGMSDEAAMRYWGTEFTRIQMEITKAYANGDTEAAGVYEELNRLMGEAAVQGGGDIKATVAWLKGAIYGSNVSDGAGRRDAGERAGIEAGGMGPLEDGGNAGRESLRRGNEPAADGAVWESARTLGIPEGTEEKIIRRTPESRWTQGMKKAARTAADIGYELVYVNGPITLNRNGRRYQPGGVIFDKKIVVQADHRLYTAEQLAKHEIFHARLQEDRAMLQEIVSAFVSRNGEREVQNITMRYANGYGFIYGTAEEHMTADELEALDMMYLEEFICDAYSGINRAFMGSVNKATQYGDIVMDIAESRVGMGNGSGGMPGARYSFAGENARTANERSLRTSRSMTGRGVDPEKVRQLTGWHQGKDGRWRFEIDDSMMKLRSTALTNYITLKEIVDHEELFAAYPELADVNIIFQNMHGKKGSFNPTFFDINLDYSLRADEGELMDVLSHEIQHAIQDIEGFTPGASEEYWEQRIRKGYDNRTRESIEEEGRLRDEYELIQREEPEFFQDMLELDAMTPSVPRGAVDFETLEQIEEDPPEWQRYDARRESLEDKYGEERVWDFTNLLYKISQSGQKGRRTPSDLYWSTAGEIEARNVQTRRAMTAEERKNTAPYLGGRDTVFAERGAVASALDPYSERQIENWSKSKKIVIYKNDQQLMDFVSRALTDKSYVGKMYFGMVGEDLADRILEETGVEVSGRNVVLRAGNVRKVIKDHGDSRAEKLSGQVAITVKDFAKIPEVISEADRMTRSDYEEMPGMLKPGILFEKALSDMRLTVYAVDSGGSLDLYMQTMYAHKNKESIANLTDENSPILTPETLVGTAPNSSISEISENSNTESRFSMDDAGKAPEEMTAAELRRAVRGDQSLLEAYAQIERAGGLTPEARRERDAVASRLVKERELLRRKNEEFSAEKQEARARQKARTVPVRAKTDFRKEMLDIFSAQSGMRQELGALIDRFAEDTLSRGAVSYQDRARLVDRLYEAGAMTMVADEYARDIRSNIAGTRIYVDERTRAEIGEAEYSAFRREAFGVGVILTSDKSDYGVNRVYGSLQEQFPGEFRIDVDDPKGMLDEIVAAAREGKAESVSLAEMMSRVEHDTGWTVADQMEAMERKVDAAIDKFIEKAALESDLKARSAVQMAQEREERRKAMERQAESRNLRDMQRKTMKALQWLKKNERRMPAEAKAQAQELLDGLDLYAISLANEMRWSGKHQATWRDLADMYQNAREHDPNFLPSKELEMIWSRVNEKKVSELDLDALETLYRAASALRTEFYNRNNVINDEEHRMFSEAYHDSVEEIRTSGGRGKLGKFFNAEQLTPVNVLQMMGGWRRNGQFFSFARMLESGERGYKAYVVDANRVLQEFIEEHQDWIKRADGQGRDAIWYEVEVPELLELNMGDKPIFGETRKVWMTPAQKVHLYLESMNHQNLRHMAGGRTFVNRALYEQGKRTEALAQGTTIRLAPESVKKLVSDLTEEEMALAKVLQQYYNQFASERINAVSNPLYGYDKAVTRDYAPIFSNRNYTKTEPGVYDMTAEGVGHLKGRQQYSKNPSYNISAFDAFQRHVEQTARFVGYSIPIRNMNTLMNWRVQGSSMRDEITHIWGEEGASYIENYIKKLQSPVFQDKSSVQKAAGKLLSNYISGVFAANPSVVMKQLLSYPMAGSVLGFGNMPTPAQIARTDSELMVKYTPELEYRRMGYATPELAQLKDNPNWTQTNKVTRFIFGGGAITWTDAGAARAIWPWAENYVRKHFPELEVGTREQIDAGQSPFYRKVAEVYNDAVTNTQSMADISHRPAIMNHDDAITKAFTMFRSDSAQAYNTIRRLGGELARATKEGDTKTARTVRISLASGVAALILSMMGGEAIDFLMALWKNKAKWYRDDEDELTAQSVGKEYLSGLGESFGGLVYGGEQVMQVILAFINREDWSFTNGIEVPGMEQLNDFIDATLEAASGMAEIVDGAFEVVKNDGDLERYLKKNSGEILGIVKDTGITMAQYLGGVPTANIEKYLLGTVRWISPELGAAYDSLFTTPTKDSLPGLKGADLAATVGDVLALRDVQADDGTSEELARLYEAGLRSAVPGTVTETFSVSGQDFTMNAAQLQEYERAYAHAIGSELDALVESDAYIEVDDETRAKMLERLYTYATQAAKRTVAPEYEGDTWTRNAAAAAEEGVPVSAYTALQAQGLSRTADKVAYIDGMRLTDDQKGVLYYYAVASDARKGDADAMMDAGMGWDTMYETMKEYMDIEAMEGVTAAQKAATFKTWSYNNLSTAQQNAAIENLTFSTGMKASTTTYDKLMAGGLSADDALAVTTAWNNLEPEEGRSTVSDLQKMNAIITTLRTPAAQMNALSSMLDETNRWKLSRAANYDITADDYVEFKNTLEDYYDYDPEGSVGALSQDEVTAAIQSMAWLTITQKAVLWQIQTMGKDGKNNPFSTAIGLDVYNAYQDWKESGEEFEVKTSGTAGFSGVEPVGWTGNYPGLQLPVW